MKFNYVAISFLLWEVILWDKIRANLWKHQKLYEKMI